MASALRLVANVPLATVSAAVGALLLGFIQWQTQGTCDPKLGCRGGITTAAVFAGVAAFGIGSALAMFAQAAASLRGKPIAAEMQATAALLVAALAAGWVTSGGWQ